MVKCFLIAFISFCLAVTVASAECTCDPNSIATNSKTMTTLYKVVALFIILVASALGVGAPLASKLINALNPDDNLFVIIKAFVGGVILATRFIHILPDAFEQLSSSCLKGCAWENFPFAGFVATVAAVATMMIESTSLGYYRRLQLRGQNSGVGEGTVIADDVELARYVHMHGHATHGNAHGDAMAAPRSASDKLDLIRQRVTTQVLEL